MILRTSNGGMSWTEFSPDLSTKDPKYIVSSGGIVGDNLGQFYGEVVFSIAPSEIQQGLIWAGTNDGKVWYTRDAGAHWNDVTQNITGLPAWGTISKIEPSHFDSGDGLHRGRFPPDGQSRALDLQDHRFRQDVDEDQRQPAQRPSARPTRG